LWLCLFATIGFFMPLLARERIFHAVLQEGTTSRAYFNSIARMQVTSRHHNMHARSYNKDRQNYIFLHHIMREQEMTEICTHPKGVSVHLEDKSQPWQGWEGQLRGYGNDGPPCNNQIFYMLSSARSNYNEHILCHITREATKIIFLMLQSGRTARECATTISHHETQGGINQISHMLLIAVMMAMRMSLYCKKQQQG
jgi:hypothetical protein